MGNLSKEERKAMMKKWRATQEKKYILSKAQVQKCFAFLEKELEQEPCDHTMRRTERWIRDNCEGAAEGIIREMREMGGYCDCEVLMNCYESYDIV